MQKHGLSPLNSIGHQLVMGLAHELLHYLQDSHHPAGAKVAFLAALLLVVWVLAHDRPKK